mmetsp:Transcript_76101/g.150851  ORF Transcript_76101/g.150851 Transcript_76101/m.150851 type:complete len:222 (+) Transcript_76101:488-1153(+)
MPSLDCEKSWTTLSRCRSRCKRRLSSFRRWAILRLQRRCSSRWASTAHCSTTLQTAASPKMRWRWLKSSWHRPLGRTAMPSPDCSETWGRAMAANSRTVCKRSWQASCSSGGAAMAKRLQRSTRSSKGLSVRTLSVRCSWTITGAGHGRELRLGRRYRLEARRAEADAPSCGTLNGGLLSITSLNKVASHACRFIVLRMCVAFFSLASVRECVCVQSCMGS